VLCRLYNKKNNWDKVKVEQDMAAPHHHRQNGEVMNPLVDTQALSDSFQTHDSSDIDSATALPQSQQHGFSRDMALQGQARDGMVAVKDDNDWLAGMNNDLQSCYMSQFGQMANPAAAPWQDVGSGGYLQSMTSPQTRMWQTVMPPF
jgi:hypothetical protein